MVIFLKLLLVVAPQLTGRPHQRSVVSRVKSRLIESLQAMCIFFLDHGKIHQYCGRRGLE